MILTSLLLPALSGAKVRARAIMCAGNMKQVSTGFQFYHNDWDGYFPRYQKGTDPNTRWIKTLSEEDLGYLPLYRNSDGPLWTSMWFCPESVQGCMRYRSLSSNSNLYKYYMSYAYPYSNGSSLCGLGGGEDMPPAKTSQIRSPSITMALIEMVGSLTISGETFNVPGTIIGTNDSSVVFGWHGGIGKSTNLLSVDGHVEYYTNGAQLGERFMDRTYWQRQAPFNTDWN
jgi:hypothetical protein